MPALPKYAREQIEALMRQELDMVQDKATLIAQKHWLEAERQVAQELGYGDTLVRIAAIKEQIESLQRELNQLESEVRERGRGATSEDYHEIGLEVSTDRYGNVPEYHRPVVFRRKIQTAWDTLVLAHLNRHVPFIQMHRNLEALHHATRRELMFCGSFEEARALYVQFKGKITELMGDDLPELLAEVQAMPSLKAPEDI